MCNKGWSTVCESVSMGVQVFRGVHWSDDVLNHENIGFWHYLQPAYNVMGFISCAGTNFLLRSAPFAQAGAAPDTPNLATLFEAPPPSPPLPHPLTPTPTPALLI